VWFKEPHTTVTLVTQINLNRVSLVVGAIRVLSNGGVDDAIDAIGLPQTQEQILRATKWVFRSQSRRHRFADRQSRRPALERSWMPACSS
jgi:hypothetical protein